MPIKHFKDMAFHLDNASAALTDVSAYINQQSLQKAISILETTGAGVANATYRPGVQKLTLPINGFINSTMEAILGPIMENGTSVTKTAAFKSGVGQYYKGEFWIGDPQISGGQDTLETFSATLTLDGALDRTSVVGT